ncbi:beta-1,3-galactosyltransferase 1-like [Ornithodoros turicata]|uniref:beta-1,3-galactosyltransferase 1-like n=1 Tax=Ornithodoros turicata TaxID=34597 RepID=UPI00313A4221
MFWNMKVLLICQRCRILWKRLVKRKIAAVFIVFAIVSLAEVQQYIQRPKRTRHCCKGSSEAEDCNRCSPHSTFFLNTLPEAGSPRRLNERANNVFPYKYIFNVPGACKSTSLHYLVATNSEPQNLVDRQQLRSSVGNFLLPNATVRRLFFMGRPNHRYPMEELHEEQSYFQDIVLGDFSGTPENATLVSVMILKWVMTYCRNAKFVIKLSNDGRLSAESLRLSYGTFKKYSAHYQLLGNLVSLNGQTCTQPSEDSEAPTDCSGAGYLTGCVYLMTQEVVRPMFYAVAKNPIIPAEDLYMTYILAESVGARKADVTVFHGCSLKPRREPLGLLAVLVRKFGLEY